MPDQPESFQPGSPPSNPLPVAVGGPTSKLPKIQGRSRRAGAKKRRRPRIPAIARGVRSKRKTATGESLRRRPAAASRPQSSSSPIARAITLVMELGPDNVKVLNRVVIALDELSPADRKRVIAHLQEMFD